MERDYLEQAVTERDRLLFLDALDALFGERLRAYEVACSIAARTRAPNPALTDYGVDQIQDAARRLGGAARRR